MEAGFSISSKKSSVQVLQKKQEWVPKQKTVNMVWKPPIQGKSKLNFDASFIQETNHASMGGVIRDDKGQEIWAMAERLTNCEDAEEAEAKALLRCLQICADKNVMPSEIETDSSAVCSAVNDQTRNLSKLCYLYRDIQRFREALGCFTMSCVKRDCNSGSHELAKCNR
ncbi:hypothetical protein ACQ4PT_032223 [Festuca glaucescens]